MVFGGFKEVVAMVSGQSVYSKLKYESGAHRVQRVPVTESQGRVHTSTATVWSCQKSKKSSMTLIQKDLRIDIYHASGAGWTKRQQGRYSRSYRSLANQYQGGDAGRTYPAEKP